MSSPADDPFRTVERMPSPVSGPAAAQADPNRTTIHPSGQPSADGRVNVTQSDGTHPMQSGPLTASGVPGYDILGELGRGGMGVVYKARHVHLNRLVALKLTLGSSRSGPNGIQRFLSEAKAVAAIKHPNVVQIHDYGEANGGPFMALEFCPGGSLAGLLAKSRASARSAAASRAVADLIGQVASGVAAAHAVGIVHRDLNPANVLLDEAGVPKVADFGLAKRGDREMTQVGDVVGTPAYMSPEQVRGESKFAGPSADVWALGVMLYEALTGTELFTGTVQEVFANILYAAPSAPSRVVPEVPGELDSICLKCLARRPDERYPTAKELADDLRRFLDGAPPCGPQTGAWANVRHIAKRRWRPIAVGALLALTVFAWQLSSHFGKGTGGPHDPTATAPEAKPHTHEAAPLVETAAVGPPAKVALRGAAATRFRGGVEVLIERTVPPDRARLFRFDETDNPLPLRQSDGIRVECQVDPPAYLYAVWVDPDHDVTPLYPWNPAKGWGSRPREERLVSKVNLPTDAGEAFTTTSARAGMATVVAFATTTPLDVPEAVIEKWFKDLPELPTPQGFDAVRGYRGAIWFNDYVMVRELKDRAPVRGILLGKSNAPSAAWQGQLQKALGEKAVFQAAVSFARTAEK